MVFASMLAALLAKVVFLLSWDFPFTDVMGNAETFANALWPVFVMPIGLLIGIGVLNYVIRAVKSSLGSFS